MSCSCTETEYKALDNVMSEIIWVEALLGELGVKLKEKSCLCCDNSDASYLSANHVFMEKQ